MKRTKFMKAMLAVGLLFGLSMLEAPVASAIPTETWDFGSPPGILPPTHTYYSSPSLIPILASGWVAGGTTTADLYGKTDGGAETGLGIYKDPNHEISTKYVISLDMSNLMPTWTSGMLTLGSLQIGDTGTVCESSVNSGVMGITSCVSFSHKAGSMDTEMVSWDKAHPYLTVTATNNDLLLQKLTESSVPEPSSLLLMGVGLIGLGFWGRKRFSSVQK
ncbi:MAG: PEP-CTERM sorting domain-containing protein [Nitrospiria bacterium]